MSEQKVHIDNVRFVAPTHDNLHALYMHDGRIVQINPNTGDVLRVVQLPTTDAIADKPAPQWGSSVTKGPY